MSSDHRAGEAARTLREKAERILSRGGAADVDLERADILRLAHELEVHQVELELQNEELRRAQADLERSRDQFADLYESAPVAYLILGPQGLIERANRAARALVGRNQVLEGLPFSSLVLEKDLFVYYEYLNQTAGHDQERGSVELRLSSPDEEASIHVRLEASLEPAANEEGFRRRLALVDITARKRAEQKLEALAASLEEQVRNRTSKLEESEAKAQAEAVQRRRLAGRLVKLLEEDRRDLSMMLHDEVGQELSGAKMEIENARRDLSPGDSTMAGRLDRTAQILGQAIACLRDTSRRLRPPSLDVLGLVPALRSLVENRLEKGCRVHFFFKEVPETLDNDLQVAVFRIAQEAITNALRHSGCSHIHLSLTVRGSSLCLTVEDDGCGFVWKEAVSDASTESPLGLMIMQERAVFAGGSLEVDSTPERGTLVMAEFPLAPPRSPDPGVASG